MNPSKLIDEEKGEVEPAVGLNPIDKEACFDISHQSSPCTKNSFSSEVPILENSLPAQQWWKRIWGFWRSAPTGLKPREPIVRKIHEMPKGYPKVAAFLDSDDNFMLYRRFGYLQSRLLLEKQDDLRRLEDDLDRLDRKDAKKNYRFLMTREGIETSQFEKRRKLMKDIETTYCEYSNLLSAAQTLTALNKPTSGEYRSVQTWMHNLKPMYDEDAEFIAQKEDLITLRAGREHAWLDASVERMLQYCNCSLVEFLFRSKETRLKTDGSGGEVYYTRERIESFVIGIIVIMILALLILPIYILYKLLDGQPTTRTYGVCIGVLLVSTLLFSACLSLFTRARRHEILAAAAAYCAVLVVFFGNVGVNSSGHAIG